MLRHHTQYDAAAAAAYFHAERHDYYVSDRAAQSEWGGELCRAFGLEAGGPVDEEHFRRLCYGLHPTAEEPLTAGCDGREGRRVFVDLSWSMPKSASLASLRDDRVFPAFIESVRWGMRELVEPEIRARVRSHGRDEDAVTGSGLWALFPHSEGRPVDGVPDVQRHVHATLFNVTDHADEGKRKAAQTGEIKRYAPYIEAAVMSDFARRLGELGYGIRRKGNFFEVNGVSESLIRDFSRRTALIERTAAERGIVNPAFKAELAGKTRESKAKGMTQAELEAMFVARLTPAEVTQLDGLTSLPKPALPSPEQSAEFALEHSFERSSVMPAKRVIEAGLRHGVGVATPDNIRAEAYQHGLVTRGDQATTRRALKREAALVAVARDGKGAMQPIDRRPAGLPKSLTAGQRDAVKHILTSKDRVTLVRGAAGVGKTTLLAEVVRRTKLPVRAVAVTGSAAEELQSVTPNASTVARFLLDEEQQKAVAGGVVIIDEASLLGTEQAADLFRLAERIDARLVLVGDISQHAAVAAGSPFRAVQELAGLPCAEVTEVVRQRGLYKAVAETLGRGKTDAALDLLEDMGHVHELAGDERLQALAGDYLAAVRKGDTVLCVAPTHAELAKVNHAVREALKADGRVSGEEITLTRLVPANLTQAELKDGHALPEGGVVQFTRSKGKHKAGERLPVSDLDAETRKTCYFAAYTESQLTLARGDTVRITAAGKDITGKHKLLTGSTYRVAKLSDKGVELDNGWTVSESFGHWNHGYATTSVSSQSKTVDVVLVSEPSASLPAAGREQLYVSLTRGKVRAAVYTDNVAELREAVTRDRGKSNAHDLLGPATRDDNPARERASVLARLATIAKSAKARVSQLKHLYRKENHYGLER